VAVLLSFLWLGAGHLYAGQIGVGVALLITDFFLWLISFTLIGLIVTIPIWLILAPIAMITSANAVSSYNTRIATQSY
jgi:TM2 domain-containing membrane protein YozV